MTYNYQSIKSQLENQFPNQELTWYDDATIQVIHEGIRTGDTSANIINRLFT